MFSSHKNTSPFMGFLRNGQLTIASCQSYTDSIENFSDYVKNVQITSTDEPREFHFSELKKNFPLKWIRPVKQLCMRYIDSYKTINQLHAFFIREIVIQNCHTEGLQIASTEAFPYEMVNGSYEKYLYYSYLVLFAHGKMKEGHKKIREIFETSKTIVDPNFKLHATTYALLSAVLQIPIITNQLMEDERSEKHEDQPGIWQLTNKVLLNQGNEQFIQQLKQFIDNGVIGQKMQVTIEKSQNLTHLYKLWAASTTKIRNKVQSFIQDLEERIKTSQINDMKLSDPKTMQQINRYDLLARYDMKQEIIYFNYETATKNYINQTVSKCYDLNESMKILKVRAAECVPKTAQRGMGMGGMGMGMDFGMGRVGRLFDDY